jgi:hypothetical protein
MSRVRAQSTDETGIGGTRCRLSLNLLHGSCNRHSGCRRTKGRQDLCRAQVEPCSVPDDPCERVQIRLDSFVRAPEVAG